MCLLTFYLYHLNTDKHFQSLGNKQLTYTVGQTHLLRELLLFKVRYYFSKVR